MSVEAVKQIIVNAAIRVGLEPAILLTLAGPESSYSARAKNPLSSAKGLFQFLDDTWAQFGRGNPYDPVANAEAGARFTLHNINQFKKAFGRSPSIGEIYMMHFLGDGGGIQLVRAVSKNPNQDAVKLFPGPASSNRSIFYTNGRHRTVGELYRVLSKKVSGRYDSLSDGLDLEDYEADTSQLEEDTPLTDGFYHIESPKGDVLERKPNGQLWQRDKTVAGWQADLVELGYDLGRFKDKNGNPTGVDGRFGPVTEKAVKQFQRDYNEKHKDDPGFTPLSVTGKLDAATKQAIEKEMEERRKEKKQEAHKHGVDEPSVKEQAVAAATPIAATVKSEDREAEERRRALDATEKKVGDLERLVESLAALFGERALRLDDVRENIAYSPNVPAIRPSAAHERVHVE